MKKLTLCIAFVLTTICGNSQNNVPLFGIFELELNGLGYEIIDNPVRDVNVTTWWQHESGYPVIKIMGFYDGDGNGGAAGNVFKVRFCPTKTGSWELITVESNDEKLHKQKEGLVISCTPSHHKGFWLPDKDHANRWYRRTNGEHPYIMGNTFYSFLSEYYKGEPTGGNIQDDVFGNAEYLNKLRFATTGDIFPNPIEKPFLDNQGNPTDDGDYSHRPNPKWFTERVDLAVQLCYEKDVIADIILNGPDSENARNAIQPKANNNDYHPYLRYIAARYCSYPNVWICLSNEYNIRTPKFSESDIVRIGLDMQEYLAYTTPLSVHGNQDDWNPELNIGNWNDHIIIQNKMKRLNVSAEYNNLNFWIGDQKPIINDELAYEGAGDGWTEEDVLEAMLGAFMGGGYASSGHKPVKKGGHYFSGNFKAEEHKALDNLLWFRQKIDENIMFWKMKPAFITDATYKEGIAGPRSGIFFQLGNDFRVMEWPGHQYVLATNSKKEKILAYLPDGTWEVKLFDISNKKETVVEKTAVDVFEFASPDSRAAFFVFTKVED